MKINLICVPADYGHGANDGSYYPVGLLSIASYLKRNNPDLDVQIIDYHHENSYKPDADIVGISASSTLNYLNVLKKAEESKKNGSIVVIGGPHASELPEQILKNRRGLIDFVFRGKSEISFAKFILQLRSKRLNKSDVEGLSWINIDGDIIHNPISKKIWSYDNYLPLNFNLIKNGIEPYWKNFKHNLNPNYDAAFILFTHFGCGYRKRMEGRKNTGSISKWCSYCSLDDFMYARKGEKIIREVQYLLDTFNIKRGSRILLKCYGDNIGAQEKILEDIATNIRNSGFWHNYDINWTFYIQSTYLNEQIAKTLVEIGTKYLFIGFDSADDNLQKYNGMGTSHKNHLKAVEICKKFGIKLQAAFVLGIAGENINSLNKTYNFAEQLFQTGLLERINTALNVVIPGAPNYDLLCEKEPSIRELDYLPTKEIQLLWLKHFCPDLSNYPEESFDIINEVINKIDLLSPGPHSSMGYISNKYASVKNESI